MADIPLKNGSQVPEELVLVIWHSMAQLLMGGNLAHAYAMYELAEFCRHEKPISERSQRILIDKSLLESDGSIRDVVKDIVLSGSEGEEIEFRLTSPYA